VFLPDGEKFYTFGLAAICWAIWNCRNQATFEGKKIKDSFCSNLLCVWLHVLLGRYDDWSGSGGDGAGDQDAKGQRFEHDEDMRGI
uniref:Uncharacterized protein n=1 Tax=Aegilops tauschii subsp. strangulata TaxID=200361 RepID=A0A453DCF0_AEGTS